MRFSGANREGRLRARERPGRAPALECRVADAGARPARDRRPGRHGARVGRCPREWNTNTQSRIRTEMGSGERTPPANLLGDGFLLVADGVADLLGVGDGGEEDNTEGGHDYAHSSSRNHSTVQHLDMQELVKFTA